MPIMARKDGAPTFDEGAAVALDLKFADADSQTGEFEGYASIFGTVDLGYDIVQKGAFAGSITRRGAGGIRLLWQHDPGDPVGVLGEVREDGRGVKVKGRILTETTRGRDCHAFVKAGAIGGLSIGYRTIKATTDQKGIRTITEADLWEVSFVTFPMNPKAVVTAVKDVELDPREWESRFREGGLSRSDAVKAVAVLKKHALRRDAGGSSAAPGDQATEAAVARAFREIAAAARTV